MVCSLLRETGYVPKPVPTPVSAPVYSSSDGDDTAQIMESIASILGDAVETISIAAGVPQKEERTAQYLAQAAAAKAQAEQVAIYTPSQTGIIATVQRPILGIPLWLWGVGGVAAFILLRTKRR